MNKSDFESCDDQELRQVSGYVYGMISKRGEIDSPR
jgi:hypothetical protein